jgi:superfamily II DNA or RNA helicase
LVIKLRDYQYEAIEHTWRWLKNAKTAPVIVLPTGSGKSTPRGCFEFKSVSI